MSSTGLGSSKKGSRIADCSMVTEFKRVYSQGISDATYSSDLKKNAFRSMISVANTVAFGSANATYGNITGSSAIPSVTVPDAPVLDSLTPLSNRLIVAFTEPADDGGETITDYEYSIDSGATYVSASTITSPFTISGLTNGTAYTVVIRAVNSVGPSSDSNSLTETPNTIVPDAPVLTSVTSKTDTSITIAFTQSTNSGPSITNYKYSLDGGSYTAFSPADTISPVTISGLTMNTTYTIRLKAVNSDGDSAESNSLTETTYTVVYENFTTVGAATWTAPEGVTEIDYLVVGGGGGGGASYSDIEVIGSVPFQASSPGAGLYWINSTAGSFYGYLYKGSSRYTASKPVRLTAPQNILPYVPPPRTEPYAYNRWYNFEMIYTVSSGFPEATNVIYVLPQGTPTSTYSNNHSAGGGGGGGGYIKTSLAIPNTKYTVTPGTTYNIYVGAGGAGGTGSAGVENAGTDGEASYFDTITASGGAGGKGSRVGANTNGGGGFFSGNIMGGRGGAGGAVNAGSITNSEVYQWNSTVLRGTTGGSGRNVNFDGAGNVLYGSGGDGGDANVAATSTPVANTGRGGEGTGAELNSFASGIAGASGLVRIKYYLTIQPFTTVGTTSWTAPSGVTSVQYLVVGGGGGGGGGHDNGGGGGGGGGMVRTGTLSVTPGTTYTVTVGSGGDASTNTYPTVRETAGGNGGNSVFDSITSLGGGGGNGSRTQDGTPGRGGDAQVSSSSAGVGGLGGGAGGSSVGGGGGGGSSGPGGNGTSGSGGSGGLGTTSSITGSNVTYGAGGSGAPRNTTSTGSIGTANRGNGGGGSGHASGGARNGSAGGSGIVVLRY